MMRVFTIKCKSFEGRLPINHSFPITAESKEEAKEAVTNRWPQVYDITVEDE